MVSGDDEIQILFKWSIVSSKRRLKITQLAWRDERKVDVTVPTTGLPFSSAIRARRKAKREKMHAAFLQFAQKKNQWESCAPALDLIKSKLFRPNALPTNCGALSFLSLPSQSLSSFRYSLIIEYYTLKYNWLVYNIFTLLFILDRV